MAIFQTLHRKVSAIAIKTIYQPERPVSLREIYYPISVSVLKRKFVPENADFLLGKTRRILIEATAGHGKSLLMRHLCLTEMCRGKYIPLLIILRRLQDDESLIDALLSEFSELGFAGDERLMLTLIKNGRLLLLLDGYDEIHPRKRAAVSRELEKICDRWPKCPIIISSRPDLGLRSFSHLTSAGLVPLEQDEQVAFVTRLIDEEAERDRFIAAMRRSEFISRVTTTPLLLTLFLVSYRAESRIPESLVEFYDLLFPTLMYRHDDMKVGFNRFRKATMSRYVQQDLLEAISFLMSKAGLVRFSRQRFFAEMRKAARLISLNASDDELADVEHDLIAVTCLIVEDGYEKYAYIHKSVQDFFAAKFILASGDEFACQFYDAVLGRFGTYLFWAQVVLFLSGLNEHLYETRFLTPLYHRYFDATGRIKKAALAQLLSKRAVVAVTEKGHYVWVGGISDSFLRILSPAYGLIVGSIEVFIEANSRKIADFLSTCDEKYYDSVHQEADENTVPLRALLSATALEQSFREHISDTVSATVRSTIHQLQERSRMFKSRRNALAASKNLGASPKRPRNSAK